RREGCRLAILCNPNNPTGNCFDPEKLLYVVSRATVPVVVDETYFEFSGETLAGAIARHENLLIIRSFSKAFGAAGLRFGYLLAQPRTALQVKKTMTAFNLSLLIQRAVLEVVRGAHRFAPYIEELVSQREAMVDALLSMGVSAHRTKTNFIPFTLGERSGALHDFLTEAGVAVRSVSGHPILANYLRVSVHSCQNNERFLSLVKSFTQR
ncbi:aminotransferase class I/II-fold pyridoxal phosphate-dependent enzyme, partial [Myxococcota bacterium]|nr:aminotransferase class I/II-fold pyridoxal phosphate-dependent enzyme [Myxococcota bacterium]